MEAVAFDRLPGWRDDRHGEALAPLRLSCARLQRGADLRVGEFALAAAAWRPLCQAAADLDAADHLAAREFFETWFSPYRATDNDRPEGLFTGYYEAALRGDWRRRGPYQIPLYKRPKDLVMVDLGRFRDTWKGKRIAGRVKGGRLLPFESRAEIEGGALAGKGLELLWVDDPVDAFFLHIQGSGRVRMADGQDVRVGYDGHNGRQYVAIGRPLVARGEIAKEAISMQSIRAWLGDNPGEAGALMASNPSFIFFRRIKGAGPIGAQGVALTPGRSLAVDKGFVPLGLPVWLDTTDPDDRPIRRLVVAQDTGGAIKGPVRGDLFWGHGENAAEGAGRMKQTGQYYLLLPRAPSS